jgi:5-methylcytosine-specific restriction protein A
MPFLPPKHALRGVSTPQQRAAVRERARSREKNRIYDGAWRKLRAWFIAENPRCGCGAPATDVDHIVSVKSDPSRRLDPSNLRSMCHSCHSRRTGADQKPEYFRSDADK